mgnify:FL=1
MFTTKFIFILLIYTLVIAIVAFLIAQYFFRKRMNANLQSKEKEENLSNAKSSPDCSEKEQPKEKSKQTVLILEPDVTIEGALNNYLNNDYIIHSFNKVAEFLKYLSENAAPDIIVLDVPPCEDVKTLFNRIKEKTTSVSPPVIQLICKNWKLGEFNTFADLYIEKPFSIYELKKGIEGLLIHRDSPSLVSLDKENPNDQVLIEFNSDCLNCINNIDWRFIEDVKMHVDNNMSNSDFTIDVLCSLLSMSRSSFYTKIKHLTGEAPADYVRSLRIQKAADLLGEDKLNINEIAEATGFNDAKYFREVFKKHYNMNPSEYKKEVQQ